MKSHLAKVSLALLSVVFVLGCQDQASGPVGLDGLGPQFAKKCPSPPCAKDDDGGGGGPTVADATVVLSVGMGTSSAQNVRIQRESDAEIHFEDVRDETGASTFSSSIALTVTHAAVLADLKDGSLGASGCVVKPANTPADVMRGLVDNFLDDGVQIRFFLLGIDKTGLTSVGSASTSAGHQIGSTFTDDATGQLISLVGAGTNKKLLPSLSATVEVTGGDINGDFTVEFRGGAVSVRDRTGRVRDHVELACPNLDRIRVTVTRSS